MPRMPDFAKHFDDASWRRLEAFSRQPGSTVSKTLQWIEAEGVVTSKSAVGRWFKQFRERDRMSEAAELADAIHTASSDAGAVDVAGAVNLQLAQRLQSALVKGGDKLAIGDLLKGAMAINSLTNAQSKINEIKAAGREALDKLKSEATKRPVTAHEIAEISRRVFG